MSDLFKFFSRAELACRCCGRLPVEDNVLSAEQYAQFGAALDRLRLIFGKPLRINSGYRCKKNNAAVGGAADSMHLKGLAVDISMLDHNEAARLMRIASQQGGWNGVGMASTFIHLDRRAQPAHWVY